MMRGTIEDFIKASGTELVRRYGARKVGDVYEVDVLNTPWVLGPHDVEARIEKGRNYIVDGIKVGGEPLGDIYIVFSGYNKNIGFILSRRKPLFSCVRTNYASPIGLQLPRYVALRPLSLVLSDARGQLLGRCIDEDVEVKRVMVLVTYIDDLYIDLSISKDLRIIEL